MVWLATYKFALKILLIWLTYSKFKIKINNNKAKYNNKADIENLSKKEKGIMAHTIT